MGMISSMPSINPQQQLNQRSNNGVATKNNMFSNNQDLSNGSNVVGNIQPQQLQHHSNNNGGSLPSANSTSPHPLGLAGLSNLTNDQRFRLQQQGLLNTTSNSSGITSDNLNNQMFGGGGGNGIGTVGMSNVEMSIGHGDGLGDLSSGIQGGQSHHPGNSPFLNAMGAIGNEANSGHNTPMLNPGGGSNTNLTCASMLDPGSNGTQGNNGVFMSSQVPIATGGSSFGVGLQQRSFLDGRFVGGWQSNKDLPDRREVIFNILDVIRQMRPDTSRMSNK
jgi:hypothetical protein